jgi:phage gpG-like protein
VHVDLKFEALEHICRVWEKRGHNVLSEIASAASASLHHYVLEEFETEGHGEWPPFWWQRRGLPKPGTPQPARPKKVKPLTARQIRNREVKAAKAKEAARKERKLRSAFGYAYGSVTRRYGGSLERPKRSTKRKPAKSYRRWQGNPKLLQDTGVLVGSLTPYTSDDVIEVYTNVRYAKYHVSHAPRHKIPLRDFFDIDTEAFERDIIQMIDVHLGRPIQPLAAE